MGNRPTSNFQTVLLHEVVRNLRLGRFWIFSLITIPFFVISAMDFSSHFKMLTEEHNQSRNRLRETFQALERPVELRFITVKVTKRPAATWALSFGTERLLPPSVSFNIVDGEPRPEYPVEKNLLNPYPRYVDWVFIVTYCLSLTAILIGHDSISAEFVGGTLKLTLVNPLSRSVFLLGKIVGMLTVVSIPLLLGASMGLLVIMAWGGAVSPGELLLFFVALLETLLAIGFFLLMATWISTLTRSSGISLILSVLFWITAVFLVPGLGRTVAALAVPVERERGVQEKIDREKMRHSGKDGGSESSLRSFLDMRDSIRTDHRSRVLEQTHLARRIASLSPLESYREALNILADTGLTRHERFLSRVREFIARLWAASERRPSTDKRSRARVDVMEFHEVEPSILQRTFLSLRELAGLLLVEIVFFFLCFVSIARMEIA